MQTITAALVAMSFALALPQCLKAQDSPIIVADTSGPGPVKGKRRPDTEVTSVTFVQVYAEAGLYPEKDSQGNETGSYFVNVKQHPGCLEFPHTPCTGSSSSCDQYYVNLMNASVVTIKANDGITVAWDPNTKTFKVSPPQGATFTPGVPGSNSLFAAPPVSPVTVTVGNASTSYTTGQFKVHYCKKKFILPGLDCTSSDDDNDHCATHK